MFNRSYPILFRILFWLVLPIAIALLVLYAYLIRSLPQTEGSLRVPALGGTVKVIRDAYAVPHIYAASDRDAFFAIGYLHAQDRMWQMEYRRRLGQGRLSEVFGANKLAVDQYMRTLGLNRAAGQALQSLDDTARDTLNAYVDGINTWIKEEHVLPVEYYILGFVPELWRPEDSILQIKLLAFDLDFNFRQELLFDLLVKHLGSLRALDLMPSYAAGPLTMQTGDTVDDAISGGLLAISRELDQRVDTGGERLGSNAWVVSGKFTRSGKPMLANDPHLPMEIPATWYLAEMKGDRLKVAGATFPGIPFVILGRNEDIAWGSTALGGDVQDLYMERINPANENEYEVDGRWEAMEVVDEYISVRAEFPAFLADPIPPLKWTVRRTRHGPLISDAIANTPNPLALRWTALDREDRTYESYLLMNYAQDWSSFKEALRGYVAPTLNFLYADRSGNIAHIAAGRIPIRDQGTGQSPVPGWLSKEWGDYISIDQLPQTLNPEVGYIVSANNLNHPPSYHYLISNSWAPPYRADRIAQELESRIKTGKRLDERDFAEIQGDQRSLQAEALLTFIRKLSGATPQQQSGIEQLRQWNAIATEDSVPAALYQSWFRHFNRLVVNDELTGDFLRPERLDALQNFAEQLNPVFIQQVVSRDPALSHAWCDRIDTRKIVETCEDMALAGIDRAVDELMRITGEYRSWGQIHEAYYEHRGFTEIDVLDVLFDRSIANGGDGFSVNVGGWKFSKDKGYQQSLGPTYRQIIDLGDWASSRFMNSTGQSGNILSAHYDDNILRHKRLEFLPMRLRAQDAENGSELLLEPTAARR